jgi:hypothetical protein
MPQTKILIWECPEGKPKEVSFTIELSSWIGEDSPCGRGLEQINLKNPFNIPVDMTAIASFIPNRLL